MKEIPITKITLVNRPIYKAMSYSRCKLSFTLDVEYLLADGQTVPGHVQCERKKDLAGKLARDQQSAASGAMFASFDEHGNYFGTVQRWTIGAGGLVPEAPQATTSVAVAA